MKKILDSMYALNGKTLLKIKKELNLDVLADGAEIGSNVTTLLMVLECIAEPKIDLAKIDASNYNDIALGWLDEYSDFFHVPLPEKLQEDIDNLKAKTRE